MTDKKAIWFNILRVRYRNFKHIILSGNLSGFKGHISTWWRDLISFRRSDGKDVFSFAGHVKFSVGEGTSTPFWCVDWYGSPLFTLFLLLFNANRSKIEMVCNLGAWINESWVWGDLGIKVGFWESFTDSYNAILDLLERQVLSLGKVDDIIWTKKKSNVFSMRSYFSVIGDHSNIP